MNYLGLNQSETERTVNVLNTLLANYHVYYQNLRNFHWNIDGDHFFRLHETFEELYTDAQTKIDEIAERILTLRSTPMSRMTQYLDEAEVEEADTGLEDHEMVSEILQNHKILIENMRHALQVAQDTKDEGTTDMVAGFLNNLEKASWMLDAWNARHKREKVSSMS